MAVDGIVAALRGVGGPQLYRRNAFRVTGLPTDADRKTVRHRQRRVLAALEAGADVDLGHDLPVGTEAVRATFDEILENPHRRLVDELFWLWGTESACECTGTVHADHDEAVRAHSAALDLEARDGRLVGNDLVRADEAWQKAARLWGTVLRRNGFWDHIRARVADLDERQLDESVVALLREHVPLTLLQPLVDLATEKSRLVDRVRTWPGVPDGTADHLLEDAATSHYEAADTAIKEAGVVLDAGNPPKAATMVLKQVMPCLDQLEELVPHGRHRRTARVRDKAALMLNNCATVLIERDGPSAQVSAGKWLRTAHSLTADPASRRTIQANQATLEEMVRTFAIIEERVDQLLSVGRSDIARTMLIGIKRQLAGSPGTHEINRLLDNLHRRPPLPTTPAHAERDIAAFLSSRPGSGVMAQRSRAAARARAASRPYKAPPVRYHSWWRRHRRKVVAFLAFAAVAIAMYLFWPRGDEGTFFAPTIAENESVGTCIATEEGWTDDEGRDEVPVVPCDQPHWAEILAYHQLYGPGEERPGEGTVHAEAVEACKYREALPPGLILTARGPSAEVLIDRDRSVFAVCLAHRTDHSMFTGGVR